MDTERDKKNTLRLLETAAEIWDSFQEERGEYAGEKPHLHELAMLAQIHVSGNLKSAITQASESFREKSSGNPEGQEQPPDPAMFRKVLTQNIPLPTQAQIERIAEQVRSQLIEVLGVDVHKADGFIDWIVSTEEGIRFLAMMNERVAVEVMQREEKSSTLRHEGDSEADDGE